MLYNLIAWIVFGFLVGAIARWLVPGPQPLGLLGTVGLGIVGSIIGGVVSRFLWGGGGLQPAGWIMSIVGAVVVLSVAVHYSRKPAA